MPSDTSRRLNARERKVVIGGAAVTALALVFVLGALPLQRRWTEREAALDVKRGQLARLQDLVASEGAIRRALDEQQRSLPALRARLLSGATSALAGSDLLELLQRYAVESRVSLDRIGVVDDGKRDTTALPALPVQLFARGDIYGLTDFLSKIQYGRTLMVVDEIAVNSSADYAGFGESSTDVDLLNWSLRLHAPYTVE